MVKLIYKTNYQPPFITAKMTRFMKGEIDEMHRQII